MTKTIRHRVVIHAPPAAVLDAIIDSRKHTAFTGHPAEIGKKAGDSFFCYGNYASGRMLEIEPGKLIVMAWRSKHWPKETYSIVSFKFSKLPGNRTQILFSQKGVPAKDCQDKSKGWDFYYWQPLKRFFKK